MAPKENKSGWGCPLVCVDHDFERIWSDKIGHGEKFKKLRNLCELYFKIQKVFLHGVLFLDKRALVQRHTAR